MKPRPGLYQRGIPPSTHDDYAVHLEDAPHTILIQPYVAVFRDLVVLWCYYNATRHHLIIRLSHDGRTIYWHELRSFRPRTLIRALCHALAVDTAISTAESDVVNTVSTVIINSRLKPYRPNQIGE